MKQRVAVFFGGRSPEHDVSIITGLQVLRAVDQERYTAFPLYVTTRGEWLVGEQLADRRSYLPGSALRGKLTEVTLDLNVQDHGVLVPRRTGIFSRPAPIPFDVAVLAFHGLFGEDGPIQGLFEVAGVPYTGMRLPASALSMDKVATKRALSCLDIPLLPHAVIRRPKEGLMPAVGVLKGAVADMPFPYCVKPVHLGSSIGVARVENLEELSAVLPRIFALDSLAMIEPFVPNLAEFNVAVAAFGGALRLSAIERPKRTTELLDFRQKYVSEPGKNSAKAAGDTSQGMLALTRDINPHLPEATKIDIRRWVTSAFDLIDGTGCPRFDFICNEATGEFWLNEINPCPGSFGYFLWEAASEPIFFTMLISLLIEEAINCRDSYRLATDPVPVEARLFQRP